MKKFLTLLVIVLSLNTYSQQVRIAQIYGSGGEPGALYNQDFIELINSGTGAVNISGWSIQFASATGSSWTLISFPTSTTIQGGGHYLIGLATGPNGNALPTPDLSAGFDISATEGKIALVNNSTLLTGSVCTSSSIVDMVGYGTTASCYETAPASTTGIDNTKSLRMKAGGCLNSNNNSFDFLLEWASPYNSTSSWPCGQAPHIYVDSNPIGYFVMTAAAGTYFEDDYIVFGTDLDGSPGNITITAPAGMEVSLTNGTGYGNSVIVPYTTEYLNNVPIYVRVPASSPGQVLGTITNVGGGTSSDVVISGVITDIEPTTQTNNIVLSNFTDNTMDISWTSGNGNSRIIVIWETAVSGTNQPSDGHQYNANSNINLAPELNTSNPGSLVVYSGSGSGPITVSGLLPGTNYTVTAFEFNGANGTNNYMTFYNFPVSGNTTGSAAVLLQRNFSSYTCPLYMASGNTTRVPTMFQASLSNLLPNTTYRYYTQAAVNTEMATYSTGAGDPILIDYTSNPVVYTYTNAPSITSPGCYGKFTTNSNGSFGGYFGFVHNADARFNPGDSIFPAIALAQDGATVVEHRYALTSSIKILHFSNTSDANSGTFIQGNSYAPAGSILFLYKDWIGVYGRPFSGSLVEASSMINNSGTAVWQNNFISGYTNTSGSWNSIIPNINPTGVQLIQAIKPMFNIYGDGVCNRNGSGVWPTGPVNTVNPTNGINPLQISIIDAPLVVPNCYIIIPVKMTRFEVQKINNNVKLSWTTEQEINSKEFIVERSANGTNWSAIETIHAAGNSQAKISYTTTDITPVKGVNFYRIKQVNTDGKFDYSPTKSILFNAAYEVLITPNPATGFVNIYIDKNNNSSVNIQLMDASGKIVRYMNTDQPHVQINTSALGRGLYFVKVIDERNVVTGKFLLQ